MQIKFKDVRGSKFIEFYVNNNRICYLYRSKFQPDMGFRLEMMQDVYLHTNGNMLSCSYGILKVFKNSNAGIDYVNANFEELVEQYNQELQNAK